MREDTTANFILVKNVLHILLAQSGVTIVVAGIAWIWLGKVAAYSAILGGVACVLPNGFLAARILALRGAPTARNMMRTAYVGEAGKLILTFLLFGIIFASVRPLSPGLVFVGFIAAQAVMWVALATVNGTGIEGLTTRTEHGSRESLGG